jgi:hypothetical protein
MSLLRQATAKLAQKDPEFRKALARVVDEDKRNVKLENEGSWATINWITPKDNEEDHWAIEGDISVTDPYSGKTEQMRYQCTLLLNPNKFFKIQEWHSDPQLAPAMEKLVWDHRTKVKDTLPTKGVATWEKFGGDEDMASRVARKFLLGAK